MVIYYLGFYVVVGCSYGMFSFVNISQVIC